MFLFGVGYVLVGVFASCKNYVLISSCVFFSFFYAVPVYSSCMFFILYVYFLVVYMPSIFCHTVVRGEVMSSRRVENMTRYELRVVQSFKSKFQLMEREYFWVIGDECACPRPRRDKEYLVSASLRVMSGSRESRLVLSPGDLARHYTKDTAKKLRRVREQDHIHNKCEKIKARV